MFENSTFPKMAFLTLIKNKKCILLLQYCRSFSVLKDEDLQNIEYIEKDNFFFNGPVFEKSQRKDICATARKQKK